ncbi:unnamed protein product [Spirodela intermedia]|uniref:SBP-type domain-containing protein n=1 Tax=Spirodela intermedia TaxID=51605 RepID=A0A7I8J1U7_SPIIN|nr:unnamed protein product [Spirodela intermedia]CAA6663290.1 unnamed protein product [Spirodela intermedia]
MASLCRPPPPLTPRRPAHENWAEPRRKDLLLLHPDGELMRLGSNVYRRSSGGTAAAAAAAGGGLFGTTSCDGGRCSSAVRCQAEGCGADLARAKHYHRRHKVCEFHSKAAAAVVHGLTQRFCQQCSR